MADECSRAMAVVGANLRTLFSCNNGRRRWRAKSLSAAKILVERLAEACAPGRGLLGGVEGGNGDVNSSRGISAAAAGLSLTTAVELGEKKKEKEKLSSRSSVSVGSTSVLVETCAAMHVHLLQWLVVVASEGEGEDADARRGAAGAGAGGGGGGGGGGSLLLDFARRVLVDLLFLLEKRLLPATGGSRREGAGQEPDLLTLQVSRDPLTLLLAAVMDALDGTKGRSTTVVNIHESPP